MNILLWIGAGLAGALAGAPSGASAVQWSAPIAVPGARAAVSTSVVIGRDDTVALALEPGLLAIRLSAGRWLALHRLSGPGWQTSSTDLAFDAHGRLLAIWTQVKAKPGQGYRGPFQVATQTWTPIKGWGAVHVIGQSGHFQLAAPRIAVDGRGDAIAAWRGLRRVGRHSVEALTTSFRPAGEGWEQAQQLPPGGPYDDIALDGSDNAYAVWTSAGASPRHYPVNRFALRSRRTGRWGSPRALPGSPASLPTIAVAPDGTAVIAWRAAIVDSEGEGTQFGAPRAIVRSPAGAWGHVQPFPGVRVHEVHAAVSPTGAIVLTWGAPPGPTLHPVPGASGMRFSRYPGSGLSLTPQQRAPDVAAGPLAYRPNGDAIVVFAQEQLELLPFMTQGPIRFSALVPREPTFSEPVTIAPHGSDPALAGAPTTSGPIEAAMSFYDAAAKRVELSLLAANGREPRG